MGRTSIFMTAVSGLMLLAAPQAHAEPEAPAYTASPITYPPTRRDAVVEDHFGQKVADPYRWLENDVRTDKMVEAWIEAENKVTNAYLETLPGRDVFAKRLKELFDFESFTVPVKKGGRYFYRRNSGLQNQAVLYVRDSLNGPERVLIDPNTWSKDGADALAELSVSSDGKRIAYAVQEGGGDKRTFRILDVASGKTLADEVKWARFTTIEWMKDGSGFFYSRFPETKGFQSVAHNHSVYFHRVGTPQSQDRLIHATPDEPKTAHYGGITDDGRYLTIVSDNGSIQPKLSVVDLQSKDWAVRHIAGDYRSSWFYIGNVDTKFYIVTSAGAERFKLVSMDIAAANPVATDVVPEQAATLKSGRLVGDTLLLSYLVDVKSEVRRFALDGKPAGTVPLPGMGVAGEISGNQGDPESFFEFSSFNRPKTIYRYDAATNKISAWATPKVDADLDNILVEQRFYQSRDGTRVPMFVVRRKDVTGPAPTILYGYGGYSLVFPPEFSPEKLAWVEQGGIYAVAHIRGGGEYGEAWHDAGRLTKKQNVFDDFIAAGEYLKAQKITPPKGLAIQGESNGGMLIGAVVNQRPDLFEAALPMVGVQDMLRFHKFTNGIFWTTEYGSPDVEADFRNLYRYSPYHNIRSGVTYPAILAVTADTDDRVIPGHSFKYVAALQAADIGPKPHLVRIESRAGHGRGKPVDKIVAETADMWAFAAKWTGLQVGPAK
ncbi:prolyl oligopeptidase [Sphingopyxis panaciterrae]|uniref:prolyl oligopeptidase family serine peptidase n=1 Tax=Sphingopyxis panaciterrae TaxID=363841 RepID=UPI00141EEE6F|nr:prolyl oligopeptidase family serine peptidase [Sphingopyxis panaciterrae]NIJ37093.1 prolyl oligopeptidase [Sphingopyxis panaciterrae]